jgi:hypothetical protein
MFYFSPETMQHFEEYGVFYIQIISSTLLAYFGGTACKLCMQMIGFSLPLSLTTPISVTVVVLQNIYEFLPTGSFVWIGVENGSSTWILHLAWLGVLWLSELYITSHIWFPGNGRMEKIDRYGFTLRYGTPYHRSQDSKNVDHIRQSWRSVLRYFKWNYVGLIISKSKCFIRSTKYRLKVFPFFAI